MKIWSYIYPGEYGGIIEVFLTENEILHNYWPFWKSAMIKKFGEGHELITEEHCIDDWITVNWAMEVIDGKTNLNEKPG